MLCELYLNKAIKQTIKKGALIGNSKYLKV